MLIFEYSPPYCLKLSRLSVTFQPYHPESETGGNVKLIVAGSRNVTNYETVKCAVDAFISQGANVTAIIEGGAIGVDRLASRYAIEHGIEHIRVPAEWNLHHKGAGAVRNRKMAEMGDALLALWDGSSRGTMNMIKVANARKLPVTVVYLLSEDITDSESFSRNGKSCLSGNQ